MESPDLPIEMLLQQAEQLVASGQLEQARRQYKRICRWDPKRWQAWLGLASAQYHLGALQDCLQAVDKALRLNPDHLHALLIGAAACLESGHYPQTLELAERVLRLEPGNVAALMNRSSALLRLNRFIEARDAAEQVLASDPGSSMAHLNRGLALNGLGDPETALDAFDAALALQPDYFQALVNRSSVLHALGRYQESLEAADLALQVQPRAVMALLNRAAALLALERLEEARGALEAILAMQPQHPKAWLNLSTVLLRLEHYEKALQAAETVLKLQPTESVGLLNRVQALLGMERYADAAAELKRIEQNRVAVRAAVVNDLRIAAARALTGLKNYAEAMARVEDVLRAEPGQPAAIQAKVEILRRYHQHEEALACLDRGLALHPGHLDLLLAKFAVLLYLKRPRQALAVLEGGSQSDVRLRLCQAEAFNELGRFETTLAIIEDLARSGMSSWQFYVCQAGALAGLQRFEEAQRALNEARQRGGAKFLLGREMEYADDPPEDAVQVGLDATELYVHFVYGRFERAEWDQGYESQIDTIRRITEKALSERKLTPVQAFAALAWPLPPELQFAIARSSAARISAGVADIRKSLNFTYPAASTGQLKIGYLSADFRNHATAHLSRSLFGMHDRQRVEIHGYFLCRDDGSEYYRDIKAACDRFVDLAGLSNAEAARRIHADGIQILVDLMGYTKFCRPEILALRPAPVQVGYLGFPGTMGAEFMDYIVVDPIVLPLEQARFYSEQPAYLPDSYQVNDRNQEIAETGVGRSEQGLPPEALVFCCFNQIYKIEPVMFEVWMRILRQVPNGVLWLIEENDEINENLRRAAAARGVDDARLIFAKRLPKNRHLERHRLADLFLDTRVYNAHTTASDALWTGVPVLTCMGETFPARVAASLLHAVGLPELITHSLEEYEALAVRLAARPAELAALRMKLADNRLRMPLFDTERFTRHLEGAFELMWERYSGGLPPAPLHVPPLPRTAG